MLERGNESEDSSRDSLPASYHYHDNSGKRAIANPEDDVPNFLLTELSLGGLPDMLKHMWFAGAARPAMPLHFHVALGREIAITDRMDLHLVWTSRRLFLKPVPAFLLDPDFWESNLQCPPACTHQTPLMDSCRQNLRLVAIGFLYTYVCLVASENDFHVAQEKRLLPQKKDSSPIHWAAWKILARELLRGHDPNMVHPRFLRAELRLSRINIIHRLTHAPFINPYIRGWNSYSDVFRDNLAWIATIIVFVTFVLTAMQVGLATDGLHADAAFQRASYGFTIFAILGPLCMFGLVVLGALINLVSNCMKFRGEGRLHYYV